MIGSPHFSASGHHVASDISFIFDKMSQTAKDLTAGTVGGIAQVKPLLL
jgi:hypothetical protein